MVKDANAAEAEGGGVMHFVRTLRRDVGGQFRTSRNLNERVMCKLLRAFWGTIYIGKGIRSGIKAMFREQLGSKVVYRGRECFVSNFAGHEYPTLADGAGFYEQYCQRSEIANVIDLRELIHRFCFGFDFYMSSWYGIDINKRVYGFSCDS